MMYGFEEGICGTYVRYKGGEWEPTGQWATKLMTREEIEREYPGAKLPARAKDKR